jgi:hypothetical protein
MGLLINDLREVCPATGGAVQHQFPEDSKQGLKQMGVGV